MSDHFYVEFYDARSDQHCATETDAHRILGTSKGDLVDAGRAVRIKRTSTRHERQPGRTRHSGRRMATDVPLVSLE